MSRFSYFFMALLAGALVLAGCGKSENGGALGAGAVDIKKLQEAFPSPTPMIQNSLDKVKFLVSQGRFEPARAELDTMSRVPNLTAEQKQAISDVTEQVKKAAAAAPGKPAQ